MDSTLDFLSPAERLTLQLKELYSNAGYRRFVCEGLEPYDIYSRNRGFLGSGGIITVSGAKGRLMALKPDVTMSIINNLPADAGPRRLYYCESVFRTDYSGNCREISQAGLEYLGGGGAEAEAEVVTLAMESLARTGGSFVLELGHNGFSAAYLARLGFSPDQCARALEALSRRSAPETAEIAREVGSGAVEGLSVLTSLAGPFLDVLERLIMLAEDRPMQAAVEQLTKLYGLLKDSPYVGSLRLDLSVGGVMDYYNGLVFKGYMNGAPAPVLAGGRYDGLMRRFGKSMPALGFAVYLGDIDRVLRSAQSEPAGSDFLTVALPKGRLGNKVYKLFSESGWGCPALDEDSRALVLEDGEKRVRYLQVKPSDVPVYVERGAADVGVCGSDVLVESRADVYELLDLKLGVCRMVCAAPDGFRDDPDLPLRVATKYPVTASEWFESRSRRVDIIKLHGSIELAPLLGLSDVIVDIVETGRTLKENGLSVVEELTGISARLVANRSSYKFKRGLIDGVAQALEARI